MELEVRPEPSRDERDALLVVLRRLLDEPPADPRGAWGRQSAPDAEDD